MEVQVDRLDHNQEDTDVLVKAEKPDREFMDYEGLCTKCHGRKANCNCEDCQCSE